MADLRVARSLALALIVAAALCVGFLGHGLPKFFGFPKRSIGTANSGVSRSEPWKAIPKSEKEANAIDDEFGTLPWEAHQRRLHRSAAAEEKREGVEEGVNAEGKHDEREEEKLETLTDELHTESERHERKKQEVLEAYNKAISRESEQHRRKVEALEKQLAELDHATDGDEERTIADHMDQGSSNKGWRWEHVLQAIAAGIVLIGCCVCQSGCAAWACCLSQTALLWEAGSCFNPAYFFYAPLDSEDAIGQTLRREARLMMLLPLLALAGASETTCEGGAPLWVYGLYLPFLIRAKVIEARILSQIAKEWSSALLGFMLGMLDHMDFFTDGVFPIQAYRCEPEATALLAHSFEQSWAWVFAPLISAVHFWGLALILLGAAVLAQQATAVVAEDAVGKSCAADVPGLGGVASYYDSESENVGGTGIAVFFVIVVKVLVENCAQLWLQASYLAVVFDHTTDSAKTKLLASLGLGLLSAGYKSVCLVRLGFNRDEMFWKIPMLLTSLIILAMIAWTCAKLFFVYSCDTHLWNITSGCVSAVAM